MDIKPIETQYKGYRFRSRLEARWAVFFDALGVKWEYEKEGFDLGEHGWYLPDFWLPEQETWVEVKADKRLCGIDISRKAHALAALGCPVVVVIGEPWVESENHIGYSGGDSGHIFYGNGGDNYHTLAVCTKCRKVGWVYADYAGRLCNCFDRDKTGSDWKILSAAYTAARSARFEHGESPIVRNERQLAIVQSLMNNDE